MAQATVEVNEQFYTVTKAAKELGLNRRTLGDHLRAGKVQGIKVDGYFWLIPLSEIERLRETPL